MGTERLRSMNRSGSWAQTLWEPSAYGNLSGRLTCSHGLFTGEGPGSANQEALVYSHVAPGSGAAPGPPQLVLVDAQEEQGGGDEEEQQQQHLLPGGTAQMAPGARQAGEGDSVEARPKNNPVISTIPGIIL